MKHKLIRVINQETATWFRSDLFSHIGWQIVRSDVRTGDETVAMVMDIYLELVLTTPDTFFRFEENKIPTEAKEVIAQLNELFECAEPVRPDWTNPLLSCLELYAPLLIGQALPSFMVAAVEEGVELHVPYENKVYSVEDMKLMLEATNA